jgi:5-methylcytosine-specific restriction endonuclease McrBC regulatory subunit McrC
VQREVFEARIRGRLLMSDYLQRYVTSGQSHRAPCQFFEFTRDNLANQILKRSLRELRRLATLLPLPSARHELCDWADRLLPFVGAVTDRSIHPADYNRLRLRGSMRHYAPIIEKCRPLLAQTYMTTELGTHR